MDFVSRYVAHQPDEKGYINYSSTENDIWRQLYERQFSLLEGRAHSEFVEGLERIGLSADTIPQLPDVSQKLRSHTGWEVAPVAALISARDFFELLATRRFPAATFIRVQEELNYVKEPDIFHEVFGHCPMLTNPVYANFVQDYACHVLNFPEQDWPLLQRFFWFTVEFGLIRCESGLRAYGGGILSSISETPYSLESDVPLRAIFEPVAVFRTPYRIDQMQSVYFVIDSFAALYQTLNLDLAQLIQRARALGEYPPFFKCEDEGNPSVHIHAC